MHMGSSVGIGIGIHLGRACRSGDASSGRCCYYYRDDDDHPGDAECRRRRRRRWVAPGGAEGAREEGWRP